MAGSGKARCQRCGLEGQHGTPADCIRGLRDRLHALCEYMCTFRAKPEVVIHRLRTAIAHLEWRRPG